MGCTLWELFKKCEWWEILGLLFASAEWQREQSNAIQEAREKAKVDEKINKGVLKRHFKRPVKGRKWR